MARDKVEFDVVGRDAGGSKAFRQVGDAAARAGDQVEDLGKKSATAGDQVDDLGDKTRKSGREADEAAEQYGGLAAEIATAQAAMRALATEIDQTGNKDLVKDLRRQQSELRKLTRIKDLLPGDGETNAEAVRFGGRIAAGVASGLSRAGGPIAAALSNVFGTLPPQAQAAIGAGLVGAGVAAAPALGAVVSGAVVGAAGAGGIIGGVAIAARHPAVQAAAKVTGTAFAEEMQRGAVSFVPATIESLGIVRDGIGEIGDDWERASEAASTMLAPLTRHVLAGAEAAVDGFADAVERSGPVVEVLGDIAEDAGELVGETFERLSENAYEGSRALAALWGVFSAGVSSVVSTIAALTAAYGWMEKFGALLVGDRDKFVQLITEEQNAKAASGELSPALLELINGFKGTGTAAATAAVDIRTFDESVRNHVDATLGARGASRELEAAIDDATAALKENGRTLNENSPKGRENAAALDRIAGSARDAYDKTLALNGSQDEANGKLARGREAFLRHADAMGMDATKAKLLADRLFAIPPKVVVTARALTDKATGELIGFEKKIKQLDGRVITVRTRITSAGEYIPGVGTLPKNRWGGIYEHAQAGLVNLREAGVYSAVSPARYAFAEPQTGGEAFIPKRGNADRSMRILDQAAGWYGAAVVPAGGGASRATPAVGGGDPHLAGRIGREVARALSGLTLVLDDRTGRTATLIARGA